MHDKNGTPIKKGDKVLIVAEITAEHASETFCNITLGIGYDQPHGEYNIQNQVTLNAKQVLLVEKAPVGEPISTGEIER